MKSLSPRVLFLVPYPIGRAPSQRFRVEQFLPFLSQAGIHYQLEPFLNEADWQALYRSDSRIQKIRALFNAFFRRLRLLFTRLDQFDYVFIHREATPIGPPIVEWVLAKRWHKKIIYDFDDAIWMADPSQFNRAGWLKNHGKVKKICKWSTTVVGGNDFLCAFAQKYNPSVICIPTVIDAYTGDGAQKLYANHRPVVGWTGSHTTLFYLNELVPVLQSLQKELAFDFVVIADEDPQLPLANYRFIPWRRDTERADLHQIDIGVMPLTNNKWSEGKCGFKLLQYYAAGIPAIASAVGVNKQIISDDSVGRLCITPDDWKRALRELIGSARLRESLASNGWAVIRNRYSLQAQQENFLRLFLSPSD